MARHPRPGQRFATGVSAGFTLLELITVLVVIGVLVTVVATRFQDDTGYTEYMAQQRLIAALRHTQMQAMQDTRQGFCHRIVFSYGTNAGFGPASATFAPGDEAASCSSSIDVASDANLRADASDLAARGVSLSSAEGFGAAIAFIGFDDVGGVITNNFSCQLAPPCRITFTGEAEVGVCLENTGFIYAC